jgi:predicted RNase H-like HicB family nuclease
MAEYLTVLCKIKEDNNDKFYYLAYLPDFGRSACSAVGDTATEALASLEEVKENVIQHFNETGRTIPTPTPTTEQIVYLRPAVKFFAEHMEIILRRNDSKGGWEGEDAHYLLGCLREEMNEFEHALLYESKARIVNEAVDVANYLMMIVDNMRNNNGV